MVEASEHAGGEGLDWRPLSHVLGEVDPGLGEVLFLLGYDYSSNIYVFGGEELVIVDPGNDYTAYMQLFGVRQRPERVRSIVLTHGHPDHAAGIVELLRSYPTIGGEARPTLVLHRDGPDVVKEIARDFGCPVVQLTGGETLTMGGMAFEVLHTPGHTWDGICLYHAATGTLVSGDAVLPDSVAEPDPGAGGDLRHYLASLRGLLGRTVECVLPGHGRPVAHGGGVVEDTYRAILQRVAGGLGSSWMDVAQALLARGYVEDCLYACGQAAEAEPENAAPRELRAVCLNELGRFEAALEALGPVQDAESESPRTRVARGYALMGLERYEESVGEFEAALAREPGLREAQMYKGMALYLSGRGEEALEVDVFRDEFARRFAEAIRARGTGEAPERGGRSP